MDYDLIYGSRLIITDALGNERKRYKAENVALAIEKYINDNFRGLAEVTVDLPDEAELFVSIESLAVFFNEVIEFVYGRAFIKMHFYTEHEKMYLKITSVPQIHCIPEKARYFIRLARDVGLDVVRGDSGVEFVIDCKMKMHFSIYAPVFKDSIQKIAEVFETVYYRDYKDKSDN